MIDTELQRRAALCYWPKSILADGAIGTGDSASILGVYPFTPVNSNAEVIRFTMSICSLVRKIIEITKRYRK